MASRTGAVVSLKNTVCSTKGFFGPISSIVFLSYDYYSEVVREVDLTKKKGLDLKNYCIYNYNSTCVHSACFQRPRRCTWNTAPCPARINIYIKKSES